MIFWTLLLTVVSKYNYVGSIRRQGNLRPNCPGRDPLKIQSQATANRQPYSQAMHVINLLIRKSRIIIDNYYNFSKSETFFYVRSKTPLLVPLMRHDQCSTMLPSTESWGRICENKWNEATGVNIHNCRKFSRSCLSVRLYERSPEWPTVSHQSRQGRNPQCSVTRNAAPSDAI